MLNPLIDSLDHLTIQELDDKINELQRKYFMSRNPQVQSQITNVLDIYKIELQERRMKELKKQQNQDNGENSLDNLINIS